MHTSPSSYRLPDLHAMCSWKAAVNPHFEDVAPASSDWVLSYVYLIPELQHRAETFKRTSSELLAAYTFPYANAEQLRMCCDFINLLFVIDEVTDVQSGKDAASSRAVVLNAMRGDGLYNDSALSQMTKDFKERFFPAVGPATARRFTRHFEEYINAVVTEASMREKQFMPDIKSYDSQRRSCSATQPVFDLFGFVLGVDLPDEVFDHPAYTELYFAAVDMVTWSNDIYSYNMEQAMGHFGTNVLAVLQKERNVPLQEAADFAGAHFKTLVDKFEAAKGRLPSYSKELDEIALKYVTSLEVWVIGNMDWSFATQRYFGKTHKEVKETLIVNLFPQRTA